MTLTPRSREAMASGVDLRLCSKCGQHFPATTEFFYRCKHSPAGLRYHCKDCTKRIARDYRRAKRAGTLPPVKKILPGDPRECGWCKVTLPWTEEFYSVHSRNPDGSIKRLDYYCRECRRKSARRYYWNDVERSRARERETRRARRERDPERYARLQKAHSRRYFAKRRREQGRDRLLDPAPILPLIANHPGGAEALAREIARRDGDRNAATWSRQIRRWRAGAKIRESAADLLAVVAADGLKDLRDFWPEEYEEPPRPYAARIRKPRVRRRTA